MTLKPLTVNSEWKIYLLLLLCSLLCYTFFLSHQFAHLNTLLSSITLDSIKNYYTFLYHASADSSLLNFEGMNYPLGEHVVYTDCQPLISALLHYLPLPADIHVGVLHFLLYGSFVVTPLFLYAIFQRFSVPLPASFLCSLAIALLSPQFLKINAGHHALAYGCLIPWCMLLVLKVIQEGRHSALIKLSLFNLLVFFIHPYLGFCFAVFTLVALSLQYAKQKIAFKDPGNYLRVFCSGVFPILFFKLFMKVTDTHLNRPDEPYGLEVMVENTGSLLSPEFGPFQDLLFAIFPARSQHFEGHSYLGFFVILLLISVGLLLPFYLRKIKWQDGLLPLFFAAGVLLAIAFGSHHKVLQALGINSPSVNQFRAVCRFAWVFYFVLPVTLIVLLSRLIPQILKEEKRAQRRLTLIASLFLLSHLSEAGGLMGLHAEAYWKFRNFFNSQLLNPEEKNILARLEKDSTQAILSLPLFHGGSEMYDRQGSSNSMAPAMLFSYHSHLPIIGIMASRGSRTETEACIQLMNSYKRKQLGAEQFNNKNLFVIVTKDPLMPDEARLKKDLQFFKRSDSLSYAFLRPEDLLRPKISAEPVIIRSGDSSLFNSQAIIYIPSSPQQPFVKTKFSDFCVLKKLDSNQVREGLYILSLHYYYQPTTYRDLALDLIVTESINGHYQWRDLLPLRCMSGFYEGYAVFETYVKLNAGGRYEFILSGKEDRSYHVSDFLLRSAETDVIIVRPKGDSLYNNFAP